MYLTEILMDSIWESASHVDGLDPSLFRKDSCGAVMMRSHYGMQSSNFGWGIDHIYPVSMGGDDNPANLRPMHCLNLQAKGADFPLYRSAVSYDGFENVANEKERRINSKKYAELVSLYHIF